MSNKTIKELADELHVSKQRIQQVIDKLPTIKKPKKTGNKFLLNPLIQKEIKKRILKKTTTEKQQVGDNYSTTNDNNYFKTLESQLNQKDKQIDKLQSLLDQQQILTLQANKKIEQLEYQSEEKEESVSQTEISEKKSWFSKLFK